MIVPLAQYGELLVRYLGPQRVRVFWLAALVLTGVGLQVANPQIIRLFIDEALAGQDAGTLLLLAAGFVGIALGVQAVGVGTTYVGETLGWTATNALRADLATHLLGLDQSFHKTRTPGEMIQRIDADVDSLSEFFSRFVLHVLANVVLLVTVLGVLLIQDWRVGLALGVFVAGALAVLVALRSVAVHRWVASAEENAQFYGLLGEYLAAREDVRANGGRSYALRRFQDRLRSWRNAEVRSWLASSWFWLSSLGLFTLANVLALGLSFVLWQRGDFTIGSAYLVFHYTEMLRRPIEELREQLQQLQRAGAGLTRIRELLAQQTRLPDQGRESLADGPLEVVLDQVTFSYEPGSPVLSDVTLRVGPAERLGLLGRTGSGKTTLGRLVARMYDVEGGAVRLAGRDVRAVALDEVRARVAVVTQDVQLFSGTVRENVTFFDASVDDALLTASLDRLGLRSWLDGLPGGLDTWIRPGDLSAGEAQLLACARAFLRDPALIVLDEATSRLDPSTQRLVDRAVAQLLRGRTAIIIAHRMATLDQVDQIAILEDGRLVEAGPRAALAADPDSAFARLRILDLGVEIR
jgi:ATP-binding cassette subfamily B protein